MKKLKLNLENLQGGEILSREQLKKVVGGYYDGDGGGSGDAASKYKCCPKDQPNSSQCSECVTVPKGKKAVCDQGVVTAC